MEGEIENSAWKREMVPLPLKADGFVRQDRLSEAINIYLVVARLVPPP